MDEVPVGRPGPRSRFFGVSLPLSGARSVRSSEVHVSAAAARHGRGRLGLVGDDGLGGEEQGGVVVQRVRDLSGAEGLNAATGAYEDLVKIGVIDAAKVTRSALQNAASIAALFLTTEAVIADKPEPAAAAMPGGDMDF